jgi:HPt (histidine-containing phosphotransfer) domain-containing protein
MTTQELYEIIGGNYEQALKIMRMDKMINKYVLKLKDSNVYESLMAAGDSMDAAALFDSAHAMKGVCANLGLTGLSEASSEIAEEFRSGNPRKMSDAEVKDILQNITDMYERVIEGIRRFEEEQ